MAFINIELDYAEILSGCTKSIINYAHIPRTETQVKVFESDIPSHTNQNIGIF